MMKKTILSFLLSLALISPAFADSLGSAVGGTAGNQSSMSGGIYLSSPALLTNGQQAGFAMDPTTHGMIIVGPATGVAVTTTPGLRTLVTLDVKTVTTGGTAVTAIAAGNRAAGGLLCNPQGATINLGINEIGTAAGTTSSGDTTFIIPGACYKVAPASTAVSVITSDSSHPFSGYGLK